MDVKDYNKRIFVVNSDGVMLCTHVSIDTAYKVNDCKFSLITLTVLDDFQEGIPVLWALPSKDGKVALMRTFEALEREGDMQNNFL